MASFTDNSQALSHFNPYIEQVPVDAYVQVGLQKQQAYNDGVQRTQAAIDSVANLPVLMPEQKAYVSERIAQLKNSVSKVVGQDFSQSQLVNQIGGLTSQIASDPIIQSAVTSAMRVQSENGRMSEAQKAGKSSIANETVYNDSIQEWLASGDAKKSFTGSYTPYTDVNKVALDAINKLHPSEQLQQLPFQMKDGQVVKDASGAPIPDYVMIQKMTKSLDVNTIQAALAGAMGPDELNQLAIDGQYQYRGYDKAALKQVTDASYNNRLHQINETLKGLSVQKLSNTSDREYQQGLDKQIQDLSLHRDSLISQYPTDVKSLDQNPKGYMGELYKQNWLSNMTNGYAYATNSLTYEKNPYEEDRLKRLDDARDSAKFLADYGPGGYKDQEMQFKRMELEEKMKIAELKAKGKLDKDGNPTVPALGAPIQGTISAAQVGEQPTLQTFTKTTEDMTFALEGAKRNVAASLFNNNADPTNNPVVTDPVTGVITYKDAASKAFVDTGIAKLRDEWIADPSSVPTAAQTYFEQFDDVNNRVNNRNKRVAEVTKAANKTFDPSVAYSNISGITIQAPGLAPTGVSAQDLAQFSKKLNQVYGGAGSGQGHVFLDEKKANDVFRTPVERALYSTIRKSHYGDDLTDSQKLVMDKLLQVSKATARNLPKIQARDKIVDESIPGLVQTEIPASFPINTGKAELKNKVLGLANTVVGDYKRQGADELPGGTKLKDINKLVNDNLSTYSLEAQGNNQYALRVSNASLDAPDASIPLTQDQVAEWFPSTNIKQFAAVNEALALTKRAPVNSTDVQGNGPTSAFVLQNPNLSDFSVKYHVEDPNKNGRYQVKAYVLDRSVKSAPNQPPTYIALDVPLPSLLGQDGLANFLENFGDQEIRDILAKPRKK